MFPGLGFPGAVTADQYFSGKIAEIRIYERLLSATEISQYYDSAILRIATSGIALTFN